MTNSSWYNMMMLLLVPEQRCLLLFLGIGALFSFHNIACATAIPKQFISEGDDDHSCQSSVTRNLDIGDNEGTAGSTKSSSSLLSQFYKSADDESLLNFAHDQALGIYHSLDIADIDNNVFGTPSLAQRKDRDEVVIGFRIEARNRRITAENYLMLCSLASPISETICQDSGISTGYIPPECDAKSWLAPRTKTAMGTITNGPEDARLFFDSVGNLGATIGMRGCHPETPYNATNPVFSIYLVGWKKIQQTRQRANRAFWHMDGIPKLLDERKFGGASWKGLYPSVTKNWIPIPPYASLADAMNFRISYGWTNGMGFHQVYRPLNLNQSIYQMVPDRFHRDKSTSPDYRGSSNFIQFEGFLLALGHRRDSAYYHYWFAACPNPPYQSIACADQFRLTTEDHVNFALGLGQDGSDLYLTWSIDDREPRISQFSASDIHNALSDGMRARHDWRSGMTLMDMCKNTE